MIPNAIAAGSTLGALQIGPRLGRQQRLGKAPMRQCAHFFQTLQGRLPWIRRFIHIALRSQIAQRKAGVIVRRPDQTIKVEFARAVHAVLMLTFDV